MLKYRCIPLLALLLLGNISHAQTEEAVLDSELPKPKVVTTPINPHNALFVGNSFSFFNDGIHNHLGSLIRSQGAWQRGKHRYRLQTLSGARMHEHESIIEDVVDAKEWPTVVLQGHSNEPIDAKRAEQFIMSTAQYVNTLRRNDIQPILFMTWAYENEPEMINDLARTYIALANRLDVQVVPVGIAFHNAMQQAPSISLYTADVLGANEKREITYRKDIKHPSRAGTYLAACVFYAALYQKSPVGIPYIADLGPQEAEQLQTIAWNTVAEFYGWQKNSSP
jgi:hypothetical protein